MNRTTTPTISKINFPIHVNVITLYTENPSINNAGILPSELEKEKDNKEISPIAPNNVTMPEGIKGSSRNEKIEKNAFFPFKFITFFAFGYVASFCIDIFLKPLRYKIKVIIAPNVSPKKEIKIPCQNPKKIMFAPVIKKEGMIPRILIRIFSNRLIRNAYSV